MFGIQRGLAVPGFPLVDVLVLSDQLELQCGSEYPTFKYCNLLNYKLVLASSFRIIFQIQNSQKVI